MHAKDFVRELEMGGFDKAVSMELASFRDASTLIITPTRTGMIPHHHDAAVRRMAPIQNARREYGVLQGGEVSDAYNWAVRYLLEQSPCKYLLTLEDDNIPPWDAHLKLLDAIHDHDLDAVGGIYRGKAPHALCMAWGDPEKSMDDLVPRDPTSHIADGTVMLVNALPTGCTLFKRELFEELAVSEGVWFRQLATPTGCRGHDIDFSLRARAAGKRLGVHCGVLVGHYDVSEGLCYWPHVPEPTRSLACPG